MSGAAKSRPNRPPNRPELEIDHDEGLLERSAALQHAAWLGMLAVVLAAALGVFGSGPLSRASGQAAGLSLDYERFERCQRTGVLTVSLAPTGAAEAMVAIDRGWLDHVRIESVSPEPRGASMEPDRAVWHFASSASAPTVATFHYVAERAGPVSGSIARDGGGRIDFTQWLWP
jgi:hypothetical protein